MLDAATVHRWLCDHLPFELPTRYLRIFARRVTMLTRKGARFEHAEFQAFKFAVEEMVREMREITKPHGRAEK